MEMHLEKPNNDFHSWIFEKPLHFSKDKLFLGKTRILLWIKSALFCKVLWHDCLDLTFPTALSLEIAGWLEERAEPCPGFVCEGLRVWTLVLPWAILYFRVNPFLSGPLVLLHYIFFFPEHWLFWKLHKV